MSNLRDRLVEIIRTKGLHRLPEPVQLASGEMSQDFIDGKEALAHWSDLELASKAIVEAVTDRGISFGAAGGLTLGADALAVGIAAVADCRWFFVRKEPKGRGTRRLVEGARLDADSTALLVDDVVTTGGSILKAVDAVAETGARVVAAATLVDRGEVARREFERRDIPYFPMATYRDLGIEPVGGVPTEIAR